MGVELSASEGTDATVTRRDAWDRLAPLWHLLFAGTLVVPTAITLLAEGLPADDRVTVAALATGLALWHWFWLVRAGGWSERSASVVAYWVGVVAFAVLLAGLGSSYNILLYSLYPLAFLTLNWWGIVPMLVLTALVSLQQGDVRGALLNVLATAGLAFVIGLVVNAVARQSEERQVALEELAATRAELADASRRTGTLEERQRLARELHDTVAQAFTSVVTHLEAADQAMPDHPEAARTYLDTARRTARDGLTEVRRTVHALRPDLLEDGTLAQALERAAKRWSADHGVPVEVRSTGTPVALRPDSEAALLRITQESLANIARHAAATRAVITLSYLGETVSLDVDDDGVGFDGTPAPHEHGGFGLVGMRERIAAVGGHLEVESAPGEGTTIAASVPA